MNFSFSHKTFRFSGLMAGAFLLSSLVLQGCGEESTSEPPADPNALITLVAPKGGEVYTVGQTVYIQWTAKTDVPTNINPVDAVDIQLSTDNGTTWGYVEGNAIANSSVKWENYPWKIDSVVVEGGKKASPVGTLCRIRVGQYSSSNPTEIAISKPFTIKAN